MQDDRFISDDPGTILDSYVSVPRALPGGAPAIPSPYARPAAAQAPAAALAPVAAPAPSDEVLYRSSYRWPAPRILICDDGSLEEGETVYVRSDTTVIGRTKGDIVIGHDTAMSGSHAELTRRDFGGKYQWVLRDLGSSNGTFVRARAVTLKPGITVQLGSKRYRFELPSGTQMNPANGDANDAKTLLVSDFRSIPDDALPALVEGSSPHSAAQVRYPFKTTRVTIGRPGCGNNIELDDLCLARLHAVVTRDVTGAWQLQAQPSLNGVWVRVDAIPLTNNNHFQCGEQRFRFHL